ncbi:D-tyrosyl-tRNA(Tyr) deacylase [Candidatus Omnitrophus magneticus]|uniref:D-aminoacyl-tRNA deacylase n=1 Tax=Candidatus Omnitrophus magneticus TaxID=1609969 RepID=A0A0F0CJL0_9BACT|nr:D-tyrosyl-tRNA(Tyr) deacylase [Candidatus Omnitrophus magneticus]
MKVVVQRVKNARVLVNGETISEINLGLLLFVCVEKKDTEEDIKILADKLNRLRIFKDDNAKMNLDIKQAGGDFLSVSQFTLVADTKKGNRPGFDNAAHPEIAEKLWNKFNVFLSSSGVTVKSGAFGMDMEVILNNDGPVTFILER